MVYPIVQDSSNTVSNKYLNQLPSLNSYCLCNGLPASQTFDSSYTKNGNFDRYNFENYTQLRNAIRQSNPEFTREQCYEELLKPYRHEKIKTWDSSLSRFKISYVCKFEDCNKEFKKVWNMVDHMRMHEGIKPFTCQICKTSFTQKGNLKKHIFIQHSNKSLRDRKKFKCNLCGKGYTEKYNLMVSSITDFANLGFLYSTYF